ncbi:amidase [Pseudomonas cavernae]|uniref:Amidase n=1 Tax=Pseudomonas cavernae TaxID=2320867 RepID=A0A385Z606_9PSED|nr:amidase [Pseudomonas cavernae]AYC34131.1 amidase [Pseudomonas cavernae]
MSYRPFIQRRPFSAALLLLLAALAGLAWQYRADLAAFPAIIGAYSAKEYCSCRYVMANPADYCVGYVKQYLPTSAFFDDAANKRVTARGLGSTQSAAWIGPHEGCRLLPQAAALPES